MSALPAPSGFIDPNGVWDSLSSFQQEYICESALPLDLTPYKPTDFKFGIPVQFTSDATKNLWVNLGIDAQVEIIGNTSTYNSIIQFLIADQTTKDASIAWTNAVQNICNKSAGL